MCRHEPLLSNTTNADDVFPDKIRNYTIDGTEYTGARRPAPVSLQLALDSCAVDSMRYTGVRSAACCREQLVQATCAHTCTHVLHWDITCLQLFCTPNR